MGFKPKPTVPTRSDLHNFKVRKIAILDRKAAIATGVRYKIMIVDGKKRKVRVPISTKIRKDAGRRHYMSLKYPSK